MKTYAYFYLMDSTRHKEIEKIAREHEAYWQNLNLDGYEGGPFVDYSGGLIIFRTDSLESAEQLVHEDPFVDHFSLTKKWVKEWSPVGVHN